MRNWRKSFLLGLMYSLISWEMGVETWRQYLVVKSNSFCLVGVRAQQWDRMCCRSSGVLEQAGESRQTPEEWIFQLLHNASVLYRPESICAWIVAIATLAGDDPAVVQMGCGLISDIWLGLKKIKESRGAALSLSEVSQKLITFFFTNLLY